ncbi:MAG: Ig-like domain-containing protein [Clostridiales bacterium]|nr:Ig-like domain-containing protein [Clostridiales bacterium]
MKKTVFGKIKTIICLMLSLCLVLPFAACEDGGIDLDTPSITVAPGSVTVKEDEEKQITAVLIASSEKIVWTSDNPAVATVTVSTSTDKTATVKGVKAGETKIKATAGDISAVCSVTVTAKGSDPENPGGDDPENPGGEDPENPDEPTVETVTIKYGETVVGDTAYDVEVEGTITFIATASKGSAITWESDHNGIASVDGGVVTGVAEGNAVITAKVSDTVKATVNVHVTAKSTGGEDPEVPPGPGGDDDEGTAINQAASQGEAEANKDAWNWFIDGGVNENEISVEKCTLTGDAFSADNKISIKYAYEGGNWTAFNLLYPMSAGKPSGYEVTFKFTSSVAGKLTVVAPTPEEFNIAAGENTIAKSMEGALVWLRFGAAGVGPLVGEFTISGIQISQIEAQQLKKPSFSYDPSSKIITIDDSVNEGHSSSYKLVFYKDGEKKGEMPVVSGQVVEPAGLEVGSYKAKLVAVGDNVRYTDSEESDTEVDIVVETLKTTKQLRKGDIATAQANMLEWVAWIDDGLITASQYDIDTESGEITIDYEYKDAINRPWYGMRLAYAFQPTVHIYHYIKLDITVESDCSITIAENVVELHAGKNEIYADISKTGAVCIIGLGHMTDNSKNVGGKFILSNIEFTDVAPEA